MNLCHDPWIPVVTPDLEMETASLVDIVNGNFTMICGSNALVFPSMTRLLVALVMDGLRCCGDEKWMRLRDTDDWAKLVSYSREKGFPKAPLLSYLEKYAKRFEMTGAHAFLQTPGLDKSDLEPWVINKVDVTKPSGDGTPSFFDHAYDGDGIGQTLAEFALTLVVAQQSFVRSNSGGIPKWGSTYVGPLGSGGLFVTGEGRSIAETVALNCVTEEDLEILSLPNRRDMPAWRRPSLPASGKIPPREVTGICDFLTIQVRRVLGKVDEDGMVREVWVAAGEAIPDARDPFLIYQKKGKEVKEVKYNPDREVVRDLPSIIAVRQDDDGSSKPKNIGEGIPTYCNMVVTILRRAADSDVLDVISLVTSGVSKSDPSSIAQLCDSRLSFPSEIIRDDLWMEQICKAEAQAEGAESQLHKFLMIFGKEAGLIEKKKKINPKKLKKNSLLTKPKRAFWLEVAKEMEDRFLSVSERPSEEEANMLPFLMSLQKRVLFGILLKGGFSVTQSKAFALACGIVDSSLAEQEDAMRDEDICLVAKRMFGRLSADDGMRSRIRRGGWNTALSQSLIEQFGSYVCPDGDVDKMDIWQFNCFSLSAFAFCQAKPLGLALRNARSFGFSMRIAGKKRSMDRKEEMVKAVLGASQQEFFPLMENAIRYCISSGCGIDCDQLLHDTMAWNNYDKRSKLKWAMHFWCKAKKKGNVAEKKKKKGSKDEA